MWHERSQINKWIILTIFCIQSTIFLNYFRVPKILINKMMVNKKMPLRIQREEGKWSKSKRMHDIITSRLMGPQLKSRPRGVHVVTQPQLRPGCNSIVTRRNAVCKLTLRSDLIKYFHEGFANVLGVMNAWAKNCESFNILNWWINCIVAWNDVLEIILTIWYRIL